MSLNQWLYVFTLVIGVISAFPLEGEPILDTSSVESTVTSSGPSIASSVATAENTPASIAASPEAAIASSTATAVNAPANIPVQGPVAPTVLSTGGTSLYSQNLLPGQGIAKFAQRNGPTSTVVETVYTGQLTESDAAQIAAAAGAIPIQSDLLGQQITSSVLSSLAPGLGLTQTNMLGDSISNNVWNSIRNSNMLSQQLTNNALNSVAASLNSGLGPNFYLANTFPFNTNPYAQFAYANYLTSLQPPLYNYNGLFLNTRLNPYANAYVLDALANSRRNFQNRYFTYPQDAKWTNI